VHRGEEVAVIGHGGQVKLSVRSTTLGEGHQCRGTDTASCGECRNCLLAPAPVVGGAEQESRSCLGERDEDVQALNDRAVELQATCTCHVHDMNRLGEQAGVAIQ
jgi:hypothetical protein